MKILNRKFGHSVIVLEPLDTISSSATRQLRVASSFGNTVLLGRGGADLSGRVLAGGAFEFDTSTGSSTSMPRRTSDRLWSDDYHVYELEWRRDRILSRVDGLEYGSSNTGAPFDQPVGPFYCPFSVLLISSQIFQENIFFNDNFLFQLITIILNIIN